MHSIFSFFTGAGFLDLGFERAGFRVDMVNEYDPEFLRGYMHARHALGSPSPAYGHHLGSAEEMDTKECKAKLRKLVAHARKAGRKVGFVGGPPCPDFSIAGKNAGHTGDNGRLTQVYFDLIRDSKPDFFVFENVEGLWRTRIHRQFYDDQKALLVEGGYALHDRLINSIEYGAPQDRSRIFLVGFLDGDAEMAFPWESQMEGLTEKQALGAAWPWTDDFAEGSDRACPEAVEALSHLTVEHWFRRNDVENHPNAKQFFSPKSDKFGRIAEGSTDSKSFKRLHRWRYSPTACYGNNEVHLHPYKARRISVSEALALQSLPPEFELPQDMSLSDAFKTVGNGVPFVAARGLAKTIMSCLEGRAELASAEPTYLVAAE